MQKLAGDIFAVNYASFGVVMILFLVLEPLGLVGIWHRMQTYFLLWPFKQQVEQDLANTQRYVDGIHALVLMNVQLVVLGHRELGPQAHVVGAVGGALNLVTRKPTQPFEYEARAGVDRAGIQHPRGI